MQRSFPYLALLTAGHAGRMPFDGDHGSEPERPGDQGGTGREHPARQERGRRLRRLRGAERHRADQHRGELDSGTYRITDTAFCITWQHYRGGVEHCETVAANSATYTLVLASGEVYATVTATPGNTDKL